MSVELKNWKELCKEKDERIKELEGKFDLIVERLEKEESEYRELAEKELDEGCLEFFHCYDDKADGIERAIKIVKGVINE